MLVNSSLLIHYSIQKKMENKRKAGYYWVREHGDCLFVIGFYSINGDWYLPTKYLVFKDDNFEEIIETPIPQPTIK